ncbi:MAG: hypothetical protein ABIG30_03070 [Candidatus Aenigmatarchaeota archaeon]
MDNAPRVFNNLVICFLPSCGQPIPEGPVAHFSDDGYTHEGCAKDYMALLGKKAGGFVCGPVTENIVYKSAGTPSNAIA